MTADVWCARREGGEETFARKMGAVSKVAQQLSHAACPTSTCSWTDFVDMLRTSKLWILAANNYFVSDNIVLELKYPSK